MNRVHHYIVSVFLLAYTGASVYLATASMGDQTQQYAWYGYCSYHGGPNVTVFIVQWMDGPVILAGMGDQMWQCACGTMDSQLLQLA